MDKNSAMQLRRECEKTLSKQFERLDNIALINQRKVLDAFKKESVQARHLCGTTGYGYDDIGRDTLCKLYADIFHSESAIVSPNIVSGTHALTLMLFGVLRPNDKLLSVSGMPYDTLMDVILADNKGSLKDFGIDFECVELVDGENQTPLFDFDKIEKKLKSEKIKAIFATRSRGYSLRQAISVEQIAKLVKFVKEISPSTLVLVDNCYGEFVEEIEPTDVGADLMAGSLIKNIGGGVAPTGGYVAGREDLVTQVSYRLTAPSLGMEEGSYVYGYLPYYQGLFFAPSAVKNALKGSLLFATAYTKLGFDTLPKPNMNPYDIVTSIKLGSAEKLIDFCGAIQSISPIDSNVNPMPWDMPGYQEQVIMAAGTFVQGSSIELSADSPIKEPYIVYVQGGVTYEHAVLALEHTLERLNV
ncbi:MAG: methionine gamma-lyase family protein [Firmicutes bacterium]|nr:methionine gamma-lyase family protein [Bacillota bacterium]MCM1393868.1 methionine gamma-lyase family protein [[Eubacterium] siraeum]